MKSAIVTGSNGFVGNAVVRELMEQGVNVVAIIHNDNRTRLMDIDGLEIISCNNSDVSNLLDFIDYGSCDVFYHFAWAGSAGNLRSDYTVQIENAKNLLDAMVVSKKLGCSKFVAAGTIMESEVYGAVHLDGNKPSPSYIYGAGKLSAHLMASALATQLDIDLIWAKITNTYGPGESSPRLVNTTIKKCMAGMSPEFTSGIQNYDFIYIDDLAHAFYLLGMYGKSHSSYIMGSSNAKPLKEFLLEMKDSIAPELDFKFGDVPFSGVNLPLSAFDTSTLEKDTGFRASVSFGEGCLRTKKWLESLGGTDGTKF